MRNSYLLFILLAGLLTSCIGTDLVDDTLVDPIIEIAPRIDSIPVGETQQFIATYYNQLGDPVDTTITWTSTNTNSITINADGLATSIDTGSVTIIAAVGAVTDSLVLNTKGVTNQVLSRTGSFIDGVSPYKASGMATLEEVNGELIVSFSSDFQMTSGPGIYVFLGRSNTGTFNFTPGGNEIDNLSAQLTQNRITNFDGARQYTVPAGIDINDYDHVVLYCITVGGVFGSAELNN